MGQVLLEQLNCTQTDMLGVHFSEKCARPAHPARPRPPARAAVRNSCPSPAKSRGGEENTRATTHRQAAGFGTSPIPYISLCSSEFLLDADGFTVVLYFVRAWRGPQSPPRC